MLKKHVLLRGALMLTCAGMFSRLIGFFYRIFLSRTIGAEGIGLYQLIFPLYAMAISMTSSGISTAISKLVSSKNAVNNRKGSMDILFCGLTLSLFLSICVSAFFFFFHRFLAIHYIHEIRTAKFIRLMAWSVPIASVHACIEAYYFGLKNTAVPACCQVFSNVIRMLALILAIFMEQAHIWEVTPCLSVYILILEEIASASFSVIALSIQLSRQKIMPYHITSMKDTIIEITATAFPLSLNRVLVNVLQSIENLMIPIQLQVYGFSASKSLSLYGILHGMAMPLILFPTVLSFSLSTMLLPAMAEAQVKKNFSYVRQTIRKTCFSCTLLGIFFWIIFFFFGRDIAGLVFKNETAGDFIRTLSWICPLLYLNPALTTILNGLGEMKRVFYHNLVCLSIRILFIILGVPKYGISSVFWGILANQFLFFILAICHFYRHIDRQ